MEDARRRLTVSRRAAAWLVHLYTASGVVCAFLSLRAFLDGQLPATFGWLALQVAIDASDGVLARAVRVKEVLPAVDGSRLDDIVDYLTYVFVPAAIVASGQVVPGSAGVLVAAAMLLSSAFGFSRADAKTDDHFFTGFPSYWNVIVLYLVAFRPGPVFSAALLLVLAALVFVPIRYVYPSRTPTLQPVTVILGSLWAAMMVAVILFLPDPPRWLLWASLVFPAYYLGLSLWLDRRRRLNHRAAPAAATTP